jgi:pimeloyl-ACP methyl ester carboxylesterase
MRTQIAGGAWVEYDDAGHGRPVVLLHAFPFSRAMWRPQVEDLQTDYRLLVPDLPGFGGSDGFRGPPSVEGMADAAAGLLDALAVAEPVVFGGLSMGGYAALAFARKYPARLRGLVLADTRAEADSAEGKANREKQIELARTQGARAVVEQMLPKLVSDATRTHEPGVVEEIQRIGSAQSPEAVVAALQAMRDRPDAGAWLRRINVPTLVIVGSADALTPPAMAQILVNGIPGAGSAVLNEAGHMSNLEQPELFNAALRAFLQKLQ